MKKKVFILLFNLIFSCGLASAQDAEKSNLQFRAENEEQNGNLDSARSLYIRAYEDYFRKGNLKAGVACGVKATALYYKDHSYQEAFDLARTIDQAIYQDGPKSASAQAALHYYVTKERLQMYMRLKKGDRARDQLKTMETQVNTASDETLANDLLYSKAIYYYTFGHNEKGNAVFKEMATKLTAQKEYDKVDEVYQTLISNGRKSNNAHLVAQSYSSYMVWKDSVNALKSADAIGKLQKKIDEDEATIAEKDSSLSTRWMIIIGLCVLLALLAGALVVGAVVLMRYILLTRRQKKTIKMEMENNALKAKFIKNISAQLNPSLKKLDSRQPEVKALQGFSDHIQTLANLESATDEKVEMVETQIPQFCENIADSIRDKVKSNVTLTVDAPKMSVNLNKEYATHILTYLLENAAEVTPEGGHITFEFKKRGAHKHQFRVSDTGTPIPENKHEDVFKPFLEIRDLAEGDGLELPICKQMALKMNGDLEIDSSYTKGTRFLLDLYS